MPHGGPHGPQNSPSVPHPAANRKERRALAKAISRGGIDLSTPQKPPTTISLGYVWNERLGVSGFWHQSILRLLRDMAGKYGFRPIAIESGPQVARARNMVVDRFLVTGDEYLLFTDTDMIFGAEDVQLLFEVDASIAGALYYNAATGSAPWSTALVEGEDGAYAPLVLPELPEPPRPPDLDPESEEGLAAKEAWIAEFAAWQAMADMPELQPRKVAAVGMGLTLIKREVVEEVRKIYGQPFEFVDDRGEDLTFCLRAAEFGFDTVVVPKARVGHVKVTVL